MKMPAPFPSSREEISNSFDLQPFSKKLTPVVKETLKDEGMDGKCRKNTFFTPLFTVFVVLGLTIRRDLNCHRVINWLLSKFRWEGLGLPEKIVKDGAVTHARKRLGFRLFQLIFEKLIAKFVTMPDDFHGRSSVAFDGVTATMPDSKSCRDEFGKPSNDKGSAGFPQMRAVALMCLALRCIIGVAYGPYTGKGTGERNLMKQILTEAEGKMLLFLLDAGLYSFELLEYFRDHTQEFLMKISAQIKVKRIRGKQFSDGSYLALITKKFPDPASPEGVRTQWITREFTVRVIHFQVPGFRAARLITNIFDQDITARDLVIHYHRRWDIEIAFDEIKTHQCATLRGQSPAVFRSKTAELVKQELFATLIVYNCVRLFMEEASSAHNKNPLLISFLDALQYIIEAIPHISFAREGKITMQLNYLLSLIAECSIDRPRRPRVNHRVVKVKSSKFKRKKSTHKSEYRNFEKEVKIIEETG